MKVQVCTGSKCSFYGAQHILNSLFDLQENLHMYPGIREDAVLDIEMLPCRNLCKKGNHGVAPVVYIDGEMIERAQAQQIMERVIDGLQAS